MSASGKCLIFAQPVPVSHPLPLVNGIYALFCWTIAASYGARYYPDDIRFAHQCSGSHPFDRLHCLRGFHLPDPCLTLVELLVVTSYVFYQSMCMGSSEVQCQISIMKLIAPSGSPLSEDVSDLPLNSSHLWTTQSTCTPATQPGSLLTGLVATLMLYPGLPYLGLTSPLISCFEQLCCSFFARLSKCSKHGVEPTQSDSQRLIHMLLNISERKGCKLLGNTGRQDEEIALSISCNGN
ncbi:uncharacterized protein [Heterodontus francisci]|uniref:uncharacterized protein n=1 Tax=Heterodontus francisci TaxID=7792 RepID=UPI00355C70AA